ncbi:MAG: hypothetical protein EHM84_04155 [Lysobacterales bacterium]|nr:MAG: hypothetical protein EHM84_04155 [Xanthomonadales bacterium]
MLRIDSRQAPARALRLSIPVRVVPACMAVLYGCFAFWGLLQAGEPHIYMCVESSGAARGQIMSDAISGLTR